MQEQQGAVRAKGPSMGQGEQGAPARNPSRTVGEKHLERRRSPWRRAERVREKVRPAGLMVGAAKQLSNSSFNPLIKARSISWSLQRVGHAVELAGMP